MNRKQLSRIIVSIFCILLFWQIMALMKNNVFIIPYPMDVFGTMIEQICSNRFYSAILYTVIRGVAGLGISFVLGSILAYISYKYKIIDDLFYPLLLLMRSIPNISYILIVLIIFSRNSAVVVILFLILFPIIYSNIYAALESIDPLLLDVMKLYPEREIYCIYKVYLPLLKNTIESSLLSGISLSLKVGVMAEIIGGTQTGIGRELNLCRLNFDMTGMYAWTGWMILLLICLDVIIKNMVNRKHKDKKICESFKNNRNGRE